MTWKEDIIALYFNAGAVVRESELSAAKARIDAMVLDTLRIADRLRVPTPSGGSRLTVILRVERCEGALRSLHDEEAAALYGGADGAQRPRRVRAGVCEGAERTEALEA
ncbi:MAG: hypothetical protein AcusKO_07200 [Acuticoccus sp.]